MTLDEMKKLINGSDIRGISIPHEEYQANLTSVEVEKIANGFLHFLVTDKNLKLENLKIAIGHDSRITGPELSNALTKVFIKAGVTVLDAGLATTPAMFMATQFSNVDADAGIMLTASHLPFFYNGLKFFTKAGGAEHEDIEKIIAYSENERFEVNGGNIEKIPLISHYANDLVEKIQKGSNLKQPLADFHIVLDAGNGAGGFFAEKVLEKLGANTKGSQFLDPDGHFPNHVPNPDNPEAMASIRKAVLEQKVDLGVIFDTDVDRAAVVDQSGEFINRNNLIAVLASILLKENPGATIVTNSTTSDHLKDFIEDMGGKQYRYISGYRNVINRAIDLNKEGIYTPLAIETSGHAALKENYFLDDGAYVVAKILMLLPELKVEKRTIGDLIKEMKQPVETDEIRFKIETENYRSYGEEVIRDLREYVDVTSGFEFEPENEEGIRVNVSDAYGSGWFLLRMSLHEPLLVLQVENDVPESNKKVFEKLQQFFEKYHDLNLNKLGEILD